ncbi:hypothetical protein ACRAKI_31710 [Saccharothrix isguenensis]
MGRPARRGTYLGDIAGMPALFGLAVNDTMWGTLNGFLHAAALLSSEGVEVKRFPGHAGASLSGLLGYLPSLADEVDRGEHAVPFGALKHRAVVGGGHGDDSYSRLVERFRSSPASERLNSGVPNAGHGCSGGTTHAFRTEDSRCLGGGLAGWVG